ncbi:GNAT family N-acetyltransferase [Duganella sp. FT80W]|uniref:GNAT family N-acetyltransferase n=1 Tax=Duganella guangzhouensis TaxID=2666084 RepID=A0A6I2L828_9BURK|nr:GNAT family protein [Duganella guangzhouensis]MRW94351.1 GNAT family N-acetyltransferase [Duganella guangzhouensis]
MLTLLPFSAEHFDHLAGWFSSERELVQWGGPGMRFPLDLPQMQAMLAEERQQQPARINRTAFDDGGRLAGHVQVVLDWDNGVGRLARVAVAPSMRGQGLAAPMLSAALAELFALPGMERAELNVFSWNAAAIRTYEKLGFRMEGVRRSSVRVGEERWDTAIMGLLRDEWEARDKSAR